MELKPGIDRDDVIDSIDLKVEPLGGVVGALFAPHSFAKSKKRMTKSQTC